MNFAVKHLTVSSQEPEATAGFWARVIGGDVEPHLQGLQVTPAPGSKNRPVVVTEKDAGDGGSATRIHLAASAEDSLKSQVAHLLALGATIVDDRRRGPLGGVGLGSVVLADPGGNQFTVASSDAEVAAVEAALDAGREVDQSGSYFADQPLDPASYTSGAATGTTD